ncbi:MAG: Hsp20/alpha crystallin family protein [Theionarchaea archaeon]|nr:Hsp20/alpha crystallin family protein [Theionarchaea archaeon]MBU6999693.1 Hsp20/alpha crystallin family protein [Theionarchaea archaeon]MBU7022408.1 Hsp20/alpha crystallin family protein [Theionarchaea archaeon]MBU7041761.1 Hsp20/alpha crystallin family protein [Theionarchaea archaeon]
MDWNIIDEMRRMEEEMDRLFNTFFSQSPYQLGPGTALQEQGQEQGKNQEVGTRDPLVDVQETETNVIVTAEFPGIERDDIDVRVRDDRVEMKAQVKDEVREEKEGFMAYGRRYLGFYRVIPLPALVQSDAARTTYKNGVLEITLPKKEQLHASQDTAAD